MKEKLYKWLNKHGISNYDIALLISTIALITALLKH